MNSRYFCVGSWVILLGLVLIILNVQDVIFQGNFMMGGIFGFFIVDFNVKIEVDGVFVDNEGIWSI